MAKTLATQTASGWTTKGSALTAEEFDDNMLALEDQQPRYGSIVLEHKSLPLRPGWAVATNYTQMGDVASWSMATTPDTTPAGWGRRAAFSPDGSMVAFAFWGTRGVVVYNTSDWSIVSGSPAPTAEANTVVFSPDGTKLAVGYRESPWLEVYNTSDWSLDTGAPSASSEIRDGIAFTPDSSQMAVGRYDGTLNVYNTSDWTAETVEQPGSNISKVEISPVGGQAVVLVWDNLIPYDTSTWNKEPSGPSIAATYGVGYGSYSPDGTLYAVRQDGVTYEVYIYNTDDWSLAADTGSLTLSNDSPGSLNWSTDGSRLYLFERFSPFMEAVETDTWTSVGTFSGHGDRAIGCALSEDGKWLATPLETSPYYGIIDTATTSLNPVSPHPDFEYRIKES